MKTISLFLALTSLASAGTVLITDAGVGVGEYSSTTGASTGTFLTSSNVYGASVAANGNVVAWFSDGAVKEYLSNGTQTGPAISTSTSVYDALIGANGNFYRRAGRGAN